MRFRPLLFLAMLGLLAGIVIGFFGFLHPAFDLFAHFRLHFAVALIASAAIWNFRCSRVPAILFAGAGFAAIATCVPGLSGVGVRDTAIAGDRTYRLLHLNLRFDNQQPELVFARIAETNADILSLNETSRVWQDALGERLGDYPHVYHCPEWSRIGGVMLYSKFPFAGDEAFCGDYASLALRDVIIDGRRVTVGTAHLRWPWPASGPRQVEALRPQLAGLGRDVLIAGDFNAVTWSAVLRRFAEAGGLAIVAGIGPTWLHRMLPISLARLVGLPIDNVLHKGDVRIVSAGTLEPVGSDHLPVLVEFVVRDTECCAKK